MENILSIGVAKELRSRFYIFGIPSRDIVLLVMLGIFVLNLKGISSFIKKDKIFLFLFVVCFFTLQGILINGFSSIPMIRADLRSLLWFLGGICFCFVLIKTGKVKFNLQILVGLTVFFLIMSVFKSTALEKALVVGLIGSHRLIESNVYTFSGFLFVPLILLFNIKDNASRYQILPIFGIVSILYSGVILSSSRSMLIVTAIISICYCLSFSLKNNDIFVNCIYLRKGIFWVLFLSGVETYLFISLISKGGIHLERLMNIGLASLSHGSRYSEIIAFFDQVSNSMSIIFGQGLGGTIASPIHLLRDTATMHVGIFNFWMKMGIVPFILVVLFLFIRILYLYIRTLRKPSIFSPFKRTANLVVLPSLFPWIASLAMSGGFSEVNFLFAGFAYLMYGEICRNGLARVLKRAKSRSRKICLIKRSTKMRGSHGGLSSETA